MKLTFLSSLLKTLSFAGSACALAQLTTFAQDATTTVGWWPDGSNPRVVAEQIGGSTREISSDAAAMLTAASRSMGNIPNPQNPNERRPSARWLSKEGIAGNGPSAQTAEHAVFFVKFTALLLHSIASAW